MSNLCYLRKPRLILRLILFSCVIFFFQTSQTRSHLRKNVRFFILDIPHVPLSVSVPIKCFQKITLGRTKIDNSFSQTPPEHTVAVFTNPTLHLWYIAYIGMLIWISQTINYEVVCNHEFVYSLNILTNS